MRAASQGLLEKIPASQALADQQRSHWLKADVDQVVASTFFGEMSEKDKNVQFVADMLIKRAPDVAGALTIYRKVLRDKSPVGDEEQSLLKSHLKLSGVVRRENGQLRVRNLIYKQVFNESWIKEHFPINWTKRLVRYAAVLIAIMIVIAALLAPYAWLKKGEAEAAWLEAETQKQAAIEQRNAAERARPKGSVDPTNDSDRERARAA